MYTDIHLHHFRAVLALSKSGETLASAQEKLMGLSIEDVIKIGENLRLVPIKSGSSKRDTCRKRRRYHLHELANITGFKSKND